MITLVPIAVHTGMEDQDGRLVLLDGKLAAVIVRLDDPEYGPLVGKWFLEACFATPHFRDALFDSPDEAAAWFAERMP